MMRSLWSGVSGLTAHQIAMDVEANNIANVNTVGFKYSRTNFQNLLSQTIRSATAPEGTLGGKNSLQIGLGVRVSAVETIFKQGSIQNTDKNTDMAISGDGFFVVSGDGGKTYRYTRAGDFTFDANGNLVDPNGYIVQGWLADPETHNIDTANGLKPISIPPGLTTPAHATSEITLKANLNSGDHVSEKSPTRATVDQSDDVNGLFNANGEKIKLVPNESDVTLKVVNLKGDTISLKLIYGNSPSSVNITKDTTSNTLVENTSFKTLKDLLNDINYAITHDSNNNKIYTSEPSVNYKTYINGDGQLIDPSNLIETISSNNTTLADILQPLDGASTASGNFKAVQNSFIGADDVGELFNANGDAFHLQAGQGITVNIQGLHENRKFVYKPNQNDSNSCSVTNNSYLAPAITSDSLEGMHWTYDSNGNKASFNVGDEVKFTLNNNDTVTFTYGKDFYTIDQLCCELNKALSQDTATNDIVSFQNGKIIESDGSGIQKVTIVADTTSPGYDSQHQAELSRLQTIFSGLDSNNASTNEFKKRDTYYFSNIQDLVNLWQTAIDDSNSPYNDANATKGEKAIVSINSDGKIQIKNTSPDAFNINISGYPPNGQDNELFTKAFSPLNGTIAAGADSQSQSMFAATHTTSIDVFDSLGAKHTLTLHFRKIHTSTGPNDPTVWDWYAEVPPPATLSQPANGYIKFNSDGSINSYNPPSLIFNPNNGATSGQAIQLNFGDMDKFNGITSFQAPSATSGQTQDGYPGGDLQQLTVDQTGTIIGVFTNGRSYPLAQVAIAKFVNNEGLMNEGGTLFAASANSGEPIIGTAGTGGRGSIQPSALEMSNVDLSRALTELIVIQRGFQANAKTITTSNQMLNTLLQLKQ
jgi:flagellar hook protein FlgE